MTGLSFGAIRAGKIAMMSFFEYYFGIFVEL
jgi:hypothetical protein